MTSGPEEAVRLHGYGEMTLRAAIATLMALAPRERSEAVAFRIRHRLRQLVGTELDLLLQVGVLLLAEYFFHPLTGKRLVCS